LRADKNKFTQERETALNEFRELLPPVRKWLYAKLPKGRFDEILSQYGFEPCKPKQK
jgi:hypothetical protein